VIATTFSRKTGKDIESSFWIYRGRLLRNYVMKKKKEIFFIIMPRGFGGFRNFLFKIL